VPQECLDVTVERVTQVCPVEAEPQETEEPPVLLV